MKLRLAITGSSGYLAQQLIARLSSDSDVEFILGLDIRPREAKVACPALFLPYDITAPWVGLREIFLSHGINAALHLAWQFNPIHNRARHQQIDVEGSQNFFRAAEAAGLRKIVYTSSTTAYTNAGNPETPLTEETPVTGTPRYLYSKDKAEVDRIAQEFMRRHPEARVIILRPCIILGPHTQNIVSKMTEWPWRSFPWMFHVRGADPPMQFLSEDDIGEILYRAVKSDSSGIFNCAGDGVVRLRELARLVGKEPLAIPPWLLYGLTQAQWILRLAPFPSGILDMIRYPWIADTTRLKTAFGCTPRLTSREALETFAASRKI